MSISKNKVVFSHTILLAVSLVIFCLGELYGQQAGFDGLTMNIANLPRLSRAKSRSVSPENFTGEKGKGGMATKGTGEKASRDLGQKWKVSPSIKVKPGKKFTLADIKGPGAIQHIWMTPAGYSRHMILRFYWDDEKEPSVECPIGDFFACGTDKYASISSIPVCVNPRSGFNCYWLMPFRKNCRITFENISDKVVTLFYQIDYTLTEVPEDMAYFHAQFRRTNPLKYKDDYVILDSAKGWGHYVGTYMTWGSNSPGWWGEGEIKFFMDGDKEFPTICGTGTEDYFCGSYGFYLEGTNTYQTYSTPFAGFPQVILANNASINPQPRMALYRWHILDPVRFEKDLKVTMQALGWTRDEKGSKYLPLEDDISSVAFWYQTEPHVSFPKLPGKEELKIK
ncbi:MAG: glycoside hydrolase family 172 protein [Planctomycetota bacterium]|jgi:hypothetical protein